MYEMMIPFCPSGAGGCQVMERVLELRTSPDEFIGGDDGAVKMHGGGSYKLSCHLYMI